MLNTAELSSDIIGILLALVLIVITLPLTEKGREPMTVALFIFALVSFMFSLSYWLVYNAIRPESRMPLAANEIGESAWFLLLASVLDAALRDSNVIMKKQEFFFTILFVAASVALWIAWTGEWVQDIIGGIPFGYFLYCCVRTLKQSAALRPIEWRILGVYCLAIIFGHFGNLIVREEHRHILEHYSYTLMFSILIWLLIKSIVVIKRHADAKKCLALTFSSCAFGFSTLYMSSGWFYQFTFVLCLVTLPLMYISVKRDVTE